MVNEKSRIAFVIPLTLHRRLKIAAAARRRTMTSLVVDAVEAAVEIEEEALRAEDEIDTAVQTIGG